MSLAPVWGSTERSGPLKVSRSGSHTPGQSQGLVSTCSLACLPLTSIPTGSGVGHTSSPMAMLMEPCLVGRRNANVPIHLGDAGTLSIFVTEKDHENLTTFWPEMHRCTQSPGQLCCHNTHLSTLSYQGTCWETPSGQNQQMRDSKPLTSTGLCTQDTMSACLKDH